MPPPGSLMALLAAADSEEICDHCKKPIRDEGRWKLVEGKLLYHCNRRWCLFVRWLWRIK